MDSGKETLDEGRDKILFFSHILSANLLAEEFLQFFWPIFACILSDSLGVQ